MISGPAPASDYEPRAIAECNYSLPPPHSPVLPGGSHKFWGSSERIRGFALKSFQEAYDVVFNDIEYLLEAALLQPSTKSFSVEVRYFFEC